jgi:hypothetical protein
MNNKILSFVFALFTLPQAFAMDGGQQPFPVRRSNPGDELKKRAEAVNPAGGNPSIMSIVWGYLGASPNALAPVMQALRPVFHNPQQQQEPQLPVRVTYNPNRRPGGSDFYKFHEGHIRIARQAPRNFQELSLGEAQDLTDLESYWTSLNVYSRLLKHGFVVAEHRASKHFLLTYIMLDSFDINPDQAWLMRRQDIRDAYKRVAELTRELEAAEKSFRSMMLALLKNESAGLWQLAVEESLDRSQSRWPNVVKAEQYYPNALNAYLLFEYISLALEASMYGVKETVHQRQIPNSPLAFVQNVHDRLIEQAEEILDILMPFATNYMLNFHSAVSVKSIHQDGKRPQLVEYTRSQEQPLNPVQKKKKKKKKKNSNPLLLDPEELAGQAETQPAPTPAPTAPPVAEPLPIAASSAPVVAAPRRDERKVDVKRALPVDHKSQAPAPVLRPNRSQAAPLVPIPARQLVEFPLEHNEAAQIIASLSSNHRRMFADLMSSDARDYHNVYTPDDIIKLVEALEKVLESSPFATRSEVFKRLGQLINHIHPMHGGKKNAGVLPAGYVRKLRSFLLLAGLFIEWPPHREDDRVLERLIAKDRDEKEGQ